MSDEPDLRRDPVTGRWVLIAPERARRPMSLSDAGPRHRTSGERTPCPFCPGQEHDTPNEVYALRAPGTAANGPDLPRPASSARLSSTNACSF